MDKTLADTLTANLKSAKTPAAHTNGVFQQVWMSDRRDNRNAIPIRTIIIEDGEQIAPPNFERDEEP